MGLFDNVAEDFSEVEEWVAGVPAGTYEVIVAAVEVEQKEKGNFLVISYTVTDGPQKGKTHKEFIRIVEGGAKTDADTNALKNLKTRLKSFGVPDEKMRTVDVDDLQGIEGVAVLADQKNNPQYRNVVRFTLPQAGMAGESLPKPAASATTGGSENPFA